MQLEQIQINDFIPNQETKDGDCFILSTKYGYIGIFICNGIAYKLPKVYINPRINYVFDRIKLIAEKTFGISLTHYQKINTFIS